MIFILNFLLLFSPTFSLNISEQLVCNEKMIFVLDSSSSINNEELYGKQHTYKKFKTEVIKIINSNDILDSNIGLMTFDNKPDIIINFNSSLDRNEIIDKITRLKYYRNTKHTNIDLTLEVIENIFIKDNFNIIKIFFFTDTHIGHEFIQPDQKHFTTIKNRFNTPFWNNDYIEKYIYYDGSQINQSVLDLFLQEKQFKINQESFRPDCKKQKCLDKYCIKKPEEYHKICINSSDIFSMYNSHCHYFCSDKDQKFLNNKLDLDTCFSNTTYTHNVTNITYLFNKTHTANTTTANTTTANTTTVNTTTANTTTANMSITKNRVRVLYTTTSFRPDQTKYKSSDHTSLNITILVLLIIIIIVIVIVITLLVLIYRKYRNYINNNIEVIHSPELTDTYNNRLFNNTTYNII